MQESYATTHTKKTRTAIILICSLLFQILLLVQYIILHSFQ